jgi:predicted nucleic acid-binding protein
MRVVVADTTPIRYLAEINHLDLLPQLFTTIHIPTLVYRELQQPSTPTHVRRQLATPLSWLVIAPEAPTSDPGLMALDEGERAALTLGVAIHADLILIDERKGTAAAAQRGFMTTGTIGLLMRAAHLVLVDLEDAFHRLRATTFRHNKNLLDDLLAKHKGTQKP